jgi:hypothetical protein
MAARLSKLGWQWLWLVATVALGLWFVGIWPLLKAGDTYSSSFDYHKSIIKDFENPQCRNYQTRPLGELREPPWGSGGSCWHIYTSRKYDASVPPPCTLRDYENYRNSWWLQTYFMVLGIGTAMTVLISAVVYFLGWVVGWILRGFRQA